jgi:peptide chain release factor 1
MLNRKDIKIEFTKGKGPGGQHKNKTSSTVRVTHIPSGIVVVIDGRCQHKNKRDALLELERRVEQDKQMERASVKKSRRDKLIHDHTIIRTYDFSNKTVTDHRTGKVAPLKQVLKKGKVDLLR